MINTQMNIINDNIMNIHPSTSRHNILPVIKPDTIPNVSQNTPTSKTASALQTTPSTQADNKEDPNTQETTNSITTHGDDDISWEDEHSSTYDLSDIKMEEHQREEGK